VDLKLARDLPDDTPDFILRSIYEFERDAAEFCFAGARGRVLDAGCGNGNLLLRALGMDPCEIEELVGMDFSKNMIGRAALRTHSTTRASLLQGSVTSLPFPDQCFDLVICSGVLTCLPTVRDCGAALREFNRVLRPGGFLVADFFNRLSHYTLVRRHILREAIDPPEYVSPSEFRQQLAGAGFKVLAYHGFDFKPCQGYLFLSRWRALLDPCFVQERFSRLLETRIRGWMPDLNLLGYRIYVRCKKKT